MNKYDPNATCPKCGSGDIWSHYYESWRYSADAPKGGAYNSLEAPIMARGCRNCQHKWDERPLDAEGEE
jgi:hypothetical protein